MVNKYHTTIITKFYQKRGFIFINFTKKINWCRAKQAYPRKAQQRPKQKTVNKSSICLVKQSLLGHLASHHRWVLLLLSSLAVNTRHTPQARSSEHHQILKSITPILTQSTMMMSKYWWQQRSCFGVFYHHYEQPTLTPPKSKWQWWDLPKYIKWQNQTNCLKSGEYYKECYEPSSKINLHKWVIIRRLVHTDKALKEQPPTRTAVLKK